MKRNDLISALGKTVAIKGYYATSFAKLTKVEVIPSRYGHPSKTVCTIQVLVGDKLTTRNIAPVNVLRVVKGDPIVLEQERRKALAAEREARWAEQAERNQRARDAKAAFIEARDRLREALADDQPRAAIRLGDIVKVLDYIGT